MLATASVCDPMPAGAQTQQIPPAPAVDTISRPVGTVNAGDLLIISVYNEDERSGEQIIDSRGMITIPGTGRLMVAGLTPAQVEERIREAFAATFVEPERLLSVVVRIRVSVLGEVRQPNMYTVEPGTSLAQLLAVAGGTSERADLEHVTVTRNDRSYEINLADGNAAGPAGDVVLFSNDLVYVRPKRGLTREAMTFALSALSAALTLVSVIVTLQRD